MSVDEKRALIAALREFVLRVSKGGATPEEMQVLPGVAELLMSVIPD